MEQLSIIEHIDFGNDRRIAVENLPADIQSEVGTFNELTQRVAQLQKQQAELEREVRTLLYARRGAMSIVQELAQALGEQFEASTSTTDSSSDNSAKQDAESESGKSYD